MRIEESLGIWEQCYGLNCCSFLNLVCPQLKLISVNGHAWNETNLQATIWWGSASCLACTPLSHYFMLVTVLTGMLRTCPWIVKASLDEFKIEAEYMHFLVSLKNHNWNFSCWVWCLFCSAIGLYCHCLTYEALRLWMWPLLSILKRCEMKMLNIYG